MRFGIVVLCIFAAWWFISGVVYEHAPLSWVIMGLAISASIVIWGLRTPVVPLGRRANVGRLLLIWVGFEVLAMVVAGNVLVEQHRLDLILPVFAIIVGLHFLPLAHGIPVRLYYATGLALIVVGIAGLAMPPLHLPLIVGSLAALILWLSAIGLVRGAR